MEDKTGASQGRAGNRDRSLTMQKSNIAVALVGMCGAGKSTMADYLQGEGWSTVYFGNVTMDELKRRGMEVNEQNERHVREDLRAKGGMGAFADLLWPKVNEGLKEGHVTIDGLYSWSEYRILRDHLGDRAYTRRRRPSRRADLGGGRAGEQKLYGSDYG